MDPTQNEAGLVAEYPWSPPQFNTNCPSLETTLELEPDAMFPENFARAIGWYVQIHEDPSVHESHNRCPDGSSFLVHCENRTFQLFDVYVSSFHLRLYMNATLTLSY
jgi:hypothetical protein